MDEVVFNYQGFKPSKFGQRYLRHKFQTLREELPYGSHVRVRLHRNQGVLKGLVQAHSAAGEFFAVATGRRLKDVVQTLLLRMRRQIDKWHSTRFDRGDIRFFVRSRDASTRFPNQSSVA